MFILMITIEMKHSYKELILHLIWIRIFLPLKT